MQKTFWNKTIWNRMIHFESNSFEFRNEARFIIYFALRPDLLFILFDKIATV